MSTVFPPLKGLFSSKLRVKVLSHFFFHPEEPFHVRRLAAAIKEPAGTVARELTHLEKNGLLTSHPVGNQKHYSLRKNLPIFDELRDLFLKTCGASAELRSALEKLSGVELAFIYGSFAKGDAHSDSDIDLMVVGEASDRKVALAVARVERGLKREINYTLFTRAELKKRLGRKDRFVQDILIGPKIMLVGREDEGLFQPHQ